MSQKESAGLSAPEVQTSAMTEIRQIPLDLIRESPWNPRQIYPEAEMNELIGSMKQWGFRQWLPIVVRPVIDAKGCEAFEIGAGHRRSRAAREADLDIVPCIVRAMTDEEFLDVLNFDNSGRKDVHPLHEAGGWRAWMEKTGKGVPDIAARIGQSEEYVYQRLKYDSLISEAREAFLAGKITGGHAILIAREKPEDQEECLEFCLPADWEEPDQGASVRELASFIQRSFRKAKAMDTPAAPPGSPAPAAPSAPAPSPSVPPEPPRSAPAPSASATKTPEPDKPPSSEDTKDRIFLELSVRLAILQAIRKKITATRALAKWEIADLIYLILDEKISRSGISELCRIHGIAFRASQNVWDDAPFIAMRKALMSLPAEEMLRLAIELPLVNEFDSGAIQRNETPVKLMYLARSSGVDAVKIRRETEEAAKNASGGKRKEVKPPAAKKQPAAKPKAAAKPAPKKAAKKAPAKKSAAPKKPTPKKSKKGA